MSRTPISTHAHPDIFPGLYQGLPYPTPQGIYSPTPKEQVTNRDQAIFMSKIQKQKTPKMQRLASSLKHAAGLLGVSVEELKLAKARGCPGFDSHNRVDLPEVSRWLLHARQKRERLRAADSPAEHFRALIVRQITHAVAIDAACRDFWDARKEMVQLLEEHEAKRGLDHLGIPSPPSLKHLSEAWELYEKIYPLAQQLVLAFYAFDKAAGISGFNQS